MLVCGQISDYSNPVFCRIPVGYRIGVKKRADYPARYPFFCQELNEVEEEERALRERTILLQRKKEKIQQENEEVGMGSTCRGGGGGGMLRICIMINLLNSDPRSNSSCFSKSTEAKQL